MKILFDFISYQLSAQRGVGRYILGLYEHMVQIGGFESYILVSNKYSLNLPESVIKSGIFYVLESWNDYNIDTNFDFFFRGDFFVPSGNTDLETILPKEVIEKCDQIVGIVYDLIPLVFAKNYLSSSAAVMRYAKAMDNLKLASHLFAISENSRQDCIKLLGINAKNITTIYGSTDEQKFITKNSNQKYDLQTRTNNLICVPGNDLRKNYTGAVRGFCLAYNSKKIPSDSKLYLICRAGETFEANVRAVLEDFSNIQIGKQIIITDYIPDALLVDLLSMARASIFPSFYEGLGLPILESYLSGTPVIGSGLSSTKDLLLSECAFNPHKAEEIAEAVINIYNDEHLCQKSLSFGRKIIKTKYNWDNCANIVINKLKDLQEHNTKQKKIAVFSCLPPQQSGIALSTYNTHSVRPELFDMISDVENLRDYQKLLHDDFCVSVFGKDLSTKEQNAKEGMFLSFHDFETKKLASYGPYVTLPAGSYDIVIEYEADLGADISFRLTVDKGKKELLNGVLDAKQNVATISVKLDKEYADVECPLFFMGKKLVLKKISFLKKNKEQKLNNIIPYDLYPYAHLSRDYIGKIFVFGNSRHHHVSLTEAIKTRGEKGRIAYLHEAIIVFVFNSLVPDLKAFLKKMYPFISDELNSGDVYDVMRKHDLCGIRPLIEMTGIRDFIVNNETAKSLIMKEVKKLNLGKCNVRLAFLPVPDLVNLEKDNSLYLNNAEFVVGSFGIPNNTKRIDDIVCAINDLNQKGHNIKLLLAGYKANDCLNNTGLDLSNTILVDNPSDDNLLKLMKSVDVAIQLRKNPHGESSGCVMQLLGMRQNLISQTGFVPADFEKYCTLISPFASIEDIEKAILIAKKNKEIPESLMKKYSFDELAKKLYDLFVK